MTELERIEIKLKHQTDLIMEIRRSLVYLINFPKYLEYSENDKPKDMWFIYTVLRNNTIINLHKLFNHKEDYSFNQLKLLVLVKYDKNEDEIARFLKSDKLGTKFYKKLEIEKIRNTHVGHLDENREHKKIDWNQIRILVEYACETHDCLNNYLFKSSTGWIVENNILNSIFRNDLTVKRLFKLKEKYTKRILRK